MVSTDEKKVSLVEPSLAALNAAREMREELAALCHEQWSGWMSYLFEKSPMGAIPDFWVSRWKRQMSTPYVELSQDERESDRKEADRFIAIISKHINDLIHLPKISPDDPEVTYQEHSASELRRLNKWHEVFGTTDPQMAIKQHDSAEFQRGVEEMRKAAIEEAGKFAGSGWGSDLSNVQHRTVQYIQTALETLEVKEAE